MLFALAQVRILSVIGNSSGTNEARFLRDEISVFEFSLTGFVNGVWSLESGVWSPRARARMWVYRFLI